jgi:chorismate dehydratase
LRQDKRLRIGKIPYANLFPIFYYLENKSNHSGYRFIKGVPSTLNRMLREGRLDISPSSSIEFLRNKDKYSILPFLSISSSGPINSILLFSKYQLDDLRGKTIAVSSESETSAVLLKIILNEFLSLRCRFRATRRSSIKNILTSSPAVLLIGDTAMREAKKIRTQNTKHRIQNTEHRIQNTEHRAQSTEHGTQIEEEGREDGSNHSLWIYDLGELWFRHTGLPFVFALWIVRRDSLPHKKELIKRLASDLIKARDYTSKRLSSIANKAPQNRWMKKEELLNYWRDISYDFTERHLEALRLFEEYARKIRG